MKKRRRLNKTVDDIQEVLSDEDESSDEVYIELNRTEVVEENKLNKSLLHETWQEEFEKEKKKQNSKKRKRSSSSSRSPTPVAK